MQGRERDGLFTMQIRRCAAKLRAGFFSDPETSEKKVCSFSIANEKRAKEKSKSRGQTGTRKRDTINTGQYSGT